MNHRRYNGTVNRAQAWGSSMTKTNGEAFSADETANGILGFDHPHGASRIYKATYPGCTHVME